MAVRALFAPGRPLRRPAIWIAWAVVLAVVAAWLVHAHGLYLQSGRSFGVLGDPDSKFPRAVDLVSPRRWAALGATAVQAGLGAFAAAAVALAASDARQRTFVLSWALAVGVGLVTAMRYTTSSAGVHYHLFLILLAAVCAGLAVPAVLEGARQAPWTLAGAAVLVTALRVAGPYGAVLAGLDAAAAAAGWLLLRGWRQAAVGVALVALLAGHVFARQRTAAPAVRPEAAVGAEIAGRTASGDLIAVRSPDPAWDEGWARANNYEEPILFYAARRHGWSLPADDPALDRLDAAVRAGARLLVERADALDRHGAALRPWLDRHARLIGRRGRYVLFELSAP
jgi:hypothetical protein